MSKSFPLPFSGCFPRGAGWAYARFALLLAVVSLACSLNAPANPNVATGSTHTFTLDEPHPGAGGVIDVNLSMAIGELHLTGGADSLIEGQVRYNVPAWEPVVTRQDGSVTVSQGDPDYTVRGFPGGEVVNTWSLKLGSLPMNISLQAAAYNATLDLSGLPVHRLDVQDGASTSEVRFDTVNPAQMRSLSYKTGASDVFFHGLANANFEAMSFEGGAGDYTFDFSGDLQRDAEVRIKVGLSDVQLLVPPGISARVFVDGRLTSISTTGSWKQNGDYFVNGTGAPQLTITVEMAAGSVKLAER